MNDDMFNKMMIEGLQNFALGLNKMKLNGKKHIKKYYHLRNIHEEIVNNMQEYMFSIKFDIQKQFSVVTKIANQSGLDFIINLESDNPDDITILAELFMYKHDADIQSITEYYLEKRKFRNDEKVKMLNSMNNSIVGLFKVISADSNEGYVVYEEVFTKKRYTIVDIAMSSTFDFNEKNEIYRYDRLITYDDITFGTGIHCTLSKKNNKFKTFISNHRNKNNNDIVNCLILYDISKNSNVVNSRYNHNFGRY